MPKLRGPLLSLGATGGITRFFSLVRRRGQNIIEKKPIPADAKSPAQLFYRHMFTKCVDLWHTLSEAERKEWERLARPKQMTGYDWFISQCLRPNPGIYLPLQGGTMAGDIDMDKNRILDLPRPTDDQEAANKFYADDVASAVDRGEGHINIIPENYDSIGQGTWTTLLTADYFFHFVFYNTTADNRDNLSYKLYLAAGIYTLRTMYHKGPTNGIAAIDIDGVEVESIDQYASNYPKNLTSTKTGIIIATPGVKTLRLRADGKNPSSTAYELNFSYFTLWRTA
ncbi:hypothetical protein ES708_20161 [subsurface metagenome]